jgi:hypothetical protein
MRLRTDQDADQPCLITHHPPPVTDGTPSVTAESHVSDGCDTCDGFVQGLSRDLAPLCHSGDPIQGGGVSDVNVVNYTSHPSHLSLVRRSGVTTLVPPVTEALAEDTKDVGEEVRLEATEGVRRSVMLSQGHAMAQGPDAWGAGQDAVTACTCADPPPSAQPSPCALCGGMERWAHQGVWRCVTCWPSAGSRTHTRADMTASAPGTTRGDQPCMTDDA